MGIVIAIPELDFEGIGKSEAEARLDLAVFFYTNWNMPVGKCATYAGLPKVVFMDELGKRNISVRYDLDALEQDLQNWKNFPPANGSNK